ncbi:hypothetical protein OCS_00682 [Ophiocordyceps sinensis CO18]|uniref:Uncharacterized protein n=1 Tax=Ophiocordyceps sinensis (strain Co18 / CGMCC 3.14243) TaxID=911162 RepID=T5APE2_OPHSC|nr:hypothetical protein OCS_00682 [Ophiocordyceps sinensis CO18]
MKLIQRSGSEYKQLDNGLDGPTRRQGMSRTAYTALWCIFIPWNMILLAGGIYGLTTHLQNSSPVKAISCDCGASIEEAAALGCKYDTLSVSWLPPQCREDQLTAEFDQAGPGGEWHYWADRNMTEPLTVQQVGALAAKPIDQAQFWTTFGWHVSHCSYYWRKEYRMRQRGLEVEHRYDRESHIQHCHMAFMSRAPLNETNTKAAVGLGGDRVGGVRTRAQKEKEQHHGGR